MINWKRIKCFLTGGHIYKSGTTECNIDEETEMVTITDVCEKCGKRYCFTVPYSFFSDPYSSKIKE